MCNVDIMTEKEEKTLVEATVVFPGCDDGALLFVMKTMKIGERAARTH
jgi:hypothetical protein